MIRAPVKAYNRQPWRPILRDCTPAFSAGGFRRYSRDRKSEFCGQPHSGHICRSLQRTETSIGDVERPFSKVSNKCDETVSQPQLSRVVVETLSKEEEVSVSLGVWADNDVGV